MNKISIPLDKPAKSIAQAVVNEPINGDGYAPSAKRSPIQNVKITTNATSNNIIQKLRDFRLWPAIFAFTAGYKLGANKAVIRHGGAGTTEIVSPASIAVRSIFLQTAVFALVTRELWRLIPDWIKRQIPFVNPRKETFVNDPNDFTSIPALSVKLQALFRKINDKLDDGAPEPAATQASLLALLIMIAQIKEQIPEFRDSTYDKSGITVDHPADELRGMDEAFDFADWAYDEFEDDNTLAKELANHKFYLLRHDKLALPGCAAHYIAISKERKTVLISIKGSSGFEDMLTDCCGQSIKHTLVGPFIRDGPTQIYGHEGILAAANRLAIDVEILIEELILPNRYKIFITGHSLGAGVAALLGVMLRARFPAFLDDQGDQLKVVAFASPPVLDHDAALACSSFCTTIVNNSDVVARASLCNLMILAEFLKRVGEKLKQKGVSPKDFESTSAFIRMLSKGAVGQLLMTQEEIESGMRQSTEQVEVKDPDHLFVAGRVLHMYDLWKKEASSTTVSGTKSETIEDRTAKRLCITDGTSLMLQYIEMDERMVTDHISSSYRSSIRSLLKN
ncbi:hypothetical protein MPSEU_000523300 [Mayamaea pseudoterrestris]|nr:hypothetical protein MPSEU_000523300 [Mayamaea pseudoterrestris]